MYYIVTQRPLKSDKNPSTCALDQRLNFIDDPVGPTVFAAT